MTDEKTQTLVLTPEQQSSVKALLKRYLPGTEVWAYGSRAKGTAKPWSDLDLVVFAEPEQKNAVAELREAFDESDLPFRVDLFIWNDIPDSFKDNIKKERVILQKKGGLPSRGADTEY